MLLPHIHAPRLTTDLEKYRQLLLEMVRETLFQCTVGCNCSGRKLIKVDVIDWEVIPVFVYQQGIHHC